MMTCHINDGDKIKEKRNLLLTVVTVQDENILYWPPPYEESQEESVSADDKALNANTATLDLYFTVFVVWLIILVLFIGFGEVGLIVGAILVISLGWAILFTMCLEWLIKC